MRPRGHAVIMRHTRCMSHAGCMKVPGYGGSELVAMPLRLTVKLGTCLRGRRSKGVCKYPLIMELEPLLACDLTCAGCSKVQHLAAAAGRPRPRGASRLRRRP